jgi:hypothetical protein
MRLEMHGKFCEHANRAHPLLTKEGFFLNCFIVRRVESRYENSRGGRTCSRDRFGYEKIYEGSMIEEKL